MKELDGHVYAFNTVVKELDIFVQLFEKITWIGYDYSDLKLDLTMSLIEHPQVKTVLLKRTGGKNFLSKLKILSNISFYLLTIKKYIKVTDVIHSRGPSVPMLLGLLLSFFYRKPRWWFKYANNWNDKKPSFFWKVQKGLMKLNTKSIGTVNGHWPEMPAHIIPFENPCLYHSLNSEYSSFNKENAKGWSLLFVGRIEKSKGYAVILDAICEIPSNKINSLVIIGDGTENDELKLIIAKHPLGSKIKFLGSQPTHIVFKYMLTSHFLLLPTVSSEGFPKVLAEGWFNGCVPIVSNISSIPHYVKNNFNGFLWEIEGKKKYCSVLSDALNIDNISYMEMVRNGVSSCHLFTYERYKQRIENEILL